MAHKEPLDELILGSASYAEDLSFRALIDLSGIVFETGLMMPASSEDTWLPFTPSDGGSGTLCIGQPWTPIWGFHPSLLGERERIVDALEERGYERTGDRYSREVPELREHVEENFFVVDVLIPAYTSRPKENVRVDEKLTTIEVPGRAPPSWRSPSRSRWVCRFVPAAKVRLSSGYPTKDMPSCLRPMRGDSVRPAKT